MLGHVVLRGRVLLVDGFTDSGPLQRSLQRFEAVHVQGTSTLIIAGYTVLKDGHL
jgi:hypothetical protein